MDKDHDAASRLGQGAAKIDKQLESISDEALLPAQATPPTPQAKARGAGQAGARTSTLGVALRLLALRRARRRDAVLAVQARCGLGLFGYLAARGVVALSGVWSRLDLAPPRVEAHILSLLLIVRGGWCSAGVEVLPRDGLSLPTPAHPAVWLCE